MKTAVHLVEHGDADGLSLRAVAAELGVKAPSLYRYFSDKEALEVAVAEEILNVMLVEFRAAAATADPETRFRRVVEVYLRFARERFPLYTFVIQHNHPERYASGAGKAVWDLMVDAASAVSGQLDDTAAAVATWAFLHGYATLEHSGAFGPSGPKGGLERGIKAFLSNFRVSHSVLKTHSERSTDSRKAKKT
ncbi:TetR/AcrR family transcriptional regulator [Granulicella arctica]|uniref:TetR/AcrR family transcriptional regulator n=1 Tax=Granulicella arctica TaxID=940613 RepID=UPI0021DFBDA1|nr:TetR/AcrR family transcriptional regulator [Granulicella arctica]